MISRLKGYVRRVHLNIIELEVSGVSYEVNVSAPIADLASESVGTDIVFELIIYHYLSLDKSKGYQVLIGFTEQLQKEFFEKFISVSGIGPKAALKAFEQPVESIADAIEIGDEAFLKGLAGIGKLKARQIIAQLQGKVGRFALIKSDERVVERALKTQNKEFLGEAKKVLKRLQYSAKEADDLIAAAIKANAEVSSLEELLNEIYRQKG